jgi:hypothetical protein
MLLSLYSILVVSLEAFMAVVVAAYTDVLLIMNYILLLFWMVTAAVVVMVRRRRRNRPHYHFPAIGIVRPAPPAEPIRITTDNYMQSFQRVAQLPDIASVKASIAQQTPVRTSTLPMPDVQFNPQSLTDDQIVIHIEPDGIPTQAQVNIRRIIKHLEANQSGS